MLEKYLGFWLVPSSCSRASHAFGTLQMNVILSRNTLLLWNLLESFLPHRFWKMYGQWWRKHPSIPKQNFPSHVLWMLLRKCIAVLCVPWHPLFPHFVRAFPAGGIICYSGVHKFCWRCFGVCVSQSPFSENRTRRFSNVDTRSTFCLSMTKVGIARPSSGLNIISFDSSRLGRHHFCVPNLRLGWCDSRVRALWEMEQQHHQRVSKKL